MVGESRSLEICICIPKINKPMVIRSTFLFSHCNGERGFKNQWSTFGALLEHFCYTFGVLHGVLLGHFWSTPWSTFGALLEYFWGTFGVLLGHFWSTP